MKNLIKRLSCLLLVVLIAFSFSACKKNNNDDSEPEIHEPSKSVPTVSVSVGDKLYFVGDSLSTVSIVLDEGCTEGTVVWKEPTKTLETGLTKYSYIFTPTDTTTYSAVTKQVYVFAISKIYQTQTDKFGYKDYLNNYIEFTRTENILNYSLTLSETTTTGTVSYEKEEIVLTNSGGVKKYTITIGEYIQLFDFESGNPILSSGAFYKYTAPDYLGTYTSNTANDTDNLSVLTLSNENGIFTYQLKYNYQGDIDTISGTFTFNNNSFTFTETNFGTWFATYNADKSITVQFNLIRGSKFIKG